MHPSTYNAATATKLAVAGEVLEIANAFFPATCDTARHRFVLIHGNPAHLDYWHPTVPFLRTLGDVVVFDLPGFGRSQTPRDGVLSLDRLADAALAVADEAAFEDFIAVGHSHGGAVAQTLAARVPSRVGGAVLLATMGTPAHGSMRLAMMPGAEAVSYAVARRMGRWPYSTIGRLFGRAEAWASWAPDPIPDGFVAEEIARVAARPEIQRSSVRANLGDPTRQLVAQASRIRAPVLVIHGKDDHLIPIRYARGLHAVLVAAGVDVLFEAVDGGHRAHVARPSMVNEMMGRWIRDRC